MDVMHLLFVFIIVIESLRNAVLAADQTKKKDLKHEVDICSYLLHFLDKSILNWGQYFSCIVPVK